MNIHYDLTKASKSISVARHERYADMLAEKLLFDVRSGKAGVADTPIPLIADLNVSAHTRVQVDGD